MASEQEDRSASMEEGADAPSTTADASVAEGGASTVSTSRAEGEEQESATAMEQESGDEDESGDEEDEEAVAAGASAPPQQGAAGLQSLHGGLRELEEAEALLGKVRAACGGSGGPAAAVGSAAEAATAAALTALAASSEQCGPELRLARFLQGAGSSLLRRLEGMSRGERSAWGQNIISHAMETAALPAITAARRAGTPMDMDAGAAGSAEAPEGEGAAARKPGPLPPPVDGEPTLLIIVRDPALALSLGEKAAAEGIKVRLARNPAGALADVVDGAARSFHGVLMEADFPIMSGMEAAIKFRAVPLSAGWGKVRPLIVMVVNGSPLANYQGFETHSQQAGVDFVANSFEDISFPNLKAHFLRSAAEARRIAAQEALNPTATSSGKKSPVPPPSGPGILPSTGLVDPTTDLPIAPLPPLAWTGAVPLSANSATTKAPAAPRRASSGGGRKSAAAAAAAAAKAAAAGEAAPATAGSGASVASTGTGASPGAQSAAAAVATAPVAAKTEAGEEGSVAAAGGAGAAPAGATISLPGAPGAPEQKPRKKMERRVRRACSHCHSKKLSCTLQRPCQRCLTIGQPCVEYTPKIRSGPKRPRKTGSMSPIRGPSPTPMDAAAAAAHGMPPAFPGGPRYPPPPNADGSSGEAGGADPAASPSSSGSPKHGGDDASQGSAKQFPPLPPQQGGWPGAFPYPAGAAVPPVGGGASPSRGGPPAGAPPPPHIEGPLPSPHRRGLIPSDFAPFIAPPAGFTGPPPPPPPPPLPSQVTSLSSAIGEGAAWPDPPMPPPPAAAVGAGKAEGTRRV